MSCDDTRVTAGQILDALIEKAKRGETVSVAVLKDALEAAGVLVVLVFLVASAGLSYATGNATDAYDRAEWGRWMSTGDLGPNGCRWDSRHTALLDVAQARPDLLVVRDVDGKACRVVAMSFVDRYTGDPFTGPGNKIDIDHIVPLAEAHRSGGWAWSEERKKAFFNDPANHIPTREGVNASKSDRDPGGQNNRGGVRPWWPPDGAAHCWYASTWVEVKSKWGLSYDEAERDALVPVLEKCGPATLPVVTFLLTWHRDQAREVAFELERLADSLQRGRP